jgi:hypothetical protein
MLIDGDPRPLTRENDLLLRPFLATIQGQNLQTVAANSSYFILVFWRAQVHKLTAAGKVVYKKDGKCLER